MLPLHAAPLNVPGDADIGLLVPDQTAVIQTAIETIRRHGDSLREFIERNEQDQISFGENPRNATYWSTSMLVAFADFFYSALVPSIAGSSMDSGQAAQWDKLFGYMIGNKDQSWMDSIIQAINFSGDKFGPFYLKGNTYLTCDTSSGADYTFKMQYSLPGSIAKGIPAAIFGLATAGAILGVGGSYFIEKFSRRELPISIRDYFSLGTHTQVLHDYQTRFFAPPQNEVGEAAEMLQPVEGISREVVLDALEIARNVKSEQLKAVGCNIIYTFCWAGIALTLWGLYMAGVNRAGYLRGYDYSSFDKNVPIPSQCIKSSPLNMSLDLYNTQYPIPGGVEFLQSLPSQSYTESDYEHYLNLLTIPGMIFALLPLTSGLIANMVISVVHCRRYFREQEVEVILPDEPEGIPENPVCAEGEIAIPENEGAESLD